MAKGEALSPIAMEIENLKKKLLKLAGGQKGAELKQLDELKEQYEALKDDKTQELARKRRELENSAKESAKDRVQREHREAIEKIQNDQTEAIEKRRQEEEKRRLEEEEQEARSTDQYRRLQRELDELKEKKRKAELSKLHRELEDQIAQHRREVEDLNNESARDDAQWEDRRNNQRGKTQSGYNRDLDVQQAFNFNRSRQEPFGYVTALTIGTGPVTPDYVLSSPLGPPIPGSVTGLTAASVPMLKTVGALANVNWDLGVEDPIEFSIRVSPVTKRIVMGLQYSTLASVDVKISWVVYEYDQAGGQYYVAFSSTIGNIDTGGTPAMGQIVKSVGDSGLDLYVGFEPASEVWAPQNFELRFKMRAKTGLAQQLYLGTSPTGKVIKTWG